MPRRSREDAPGAFLHIFDRTVAKRPGFECRADVRFLLSRLAREHRRGRLRIHAFVVLHDHFHLLVESPVGQLSEAMRVALNEYVRWFNRRRKRDGPLFRGRFGSRRVRSEAYWWTLLRYIDLHPVKARIATSAGIYPFGSAYYYLSADGPKWLTRDRVEALLTQGLEPFTPEVYERLLAHPLTDAERELVKLRMRGGHAEEDPLDQLIVCGPSGVRDWMIRKAANADGTRPGIAVAAPTCLIDVVLARRFEDPNWMAQTSRQRRDGWDLILAGLLRDACGLSFAEAAARLSISESGVRSRLVAHRRLIEESDEYGARAASVLSEALRMLGSPRIGGEFR